jgi:hypothetical protein
MDNYLFIIMVGLIWTGLLFALGNSIIEDTVKEKKKMVIRNYFLYYAHFFGFAVFTGFLTIAWWPMGCFLFLLFSLLLTIFFSKVYMNRGGKKYLFITHLAGYANWDWDMSPFAFSPRFIILLLLFWVFLILMQKGYSGQAWLFLAILFIFLFFMYTGYQTELKKRSKK